MAETARHGSGSRWAIGTILWLAGVACADADAGRAPAVAADEDPGPAEPAAVEMPDIWLNAGSDDCLYANPVGHSLLNVVSESVWNALTPLSRSYHIRIRVV